MSFICILTVTWSICVESWASWYTEGIKKSKTISQGLCGLYNMRDACMQDTESKQ